MFDACPFPRNILRYISHILTEKRLEIRLEFTYYKRWNVTCQTYIYKIQ